MRKFDVMLYPNPCNLPVGLDPWGRANLLRIDPHQTLDVTDNTISIGPWTRSVEKELTKISCSEQSIKLDDPDGAIWAWLQSNLPQATSSDGSYTYLYPPFLAIDIDQARAFTGVIESKSINKDYKTGVISIQAKDWSLTLADKALGPQYPWDDATDPALNPWLRPYVNVGDHGVVTATMECSFTQISSTADGFDYVSFQGSNPFSVGDYVTVAVAGLQDWPAHTYKVASVTQVTGPSGAVAGLYTMRIDGLGADVWPYIGQYGNNTIMRRISYSKYFKTCTVSQINTKLTTRPYYLVTQAVASDAKGVYSIKLDTVSQLYPYDVLETLGSTDSKTFTVLQVDAETLTVTVKEEVSNLAIGTQLCWNEETSQTLVMQDPKELIKRAVCWPYAGYGVDFSRWVPQDLGTPVLYWVAADLPMSVSDISAERTQAMALCKTGATPLISEGKYQADYATRYAPWTDHMTAAPEVLFPDESATLSKREASSNRVHWHGIRTKSDDDSYESDPHQISDAASPTCLIYDYRTSRRILAKSGVSTSIEVCTAAAHTANFGAAQIYDFPMPVLSMAPLMSTSDSYYQDPDVILVLSADGTRSFNTRTGAVGMKFAHPYPTFAKGVLKATPWGTYIVTQYGYGVFSAGWGMYGEFLTGQDSLLPNTFVGHEGSRICCLAYRQVADDQGVNHPEIHLVQSSWGNYGELGTMERISEGIPLIAKAMRDPSDLTSVIGVVGNRVYTVSSKATKDRAIERIQPGSMKALEMLEYIAGVYNVAMVPDPLGVMHVVSKSEQAPQTLIVDQVSGKESFCWDNFFSLVRVSAAKDSSVYVDARGRAGGAVLEMSQHPLITSLSGCRAMADLTSSWLGVPRAALDVKWFWVDPDQPAPWEHLGPMSVVKINSDPRSWLVYSIQDDKFKGEATCKLIQVFPSASGFQFHIDKTPGTTVGPTCDYRYQSSASAPLDMLLTPKYSEVIEVLPAELQFHALDGTVLTEDTVTATNIFGLAIQAQGTPQTWRLTAAAGIPAMFGLPAGQAGYLDLTVRCAGITVPVRYAL